MRNINLWTIVICLAGGLYVYKYYPKDGAKLELALPAVNPAPRPTAPPPEPQKAPKPAPIGVMPR
ncbi:hypothetical protein R6138_01141 [Ralstonia thomasii]|nr:hypothetical protein R6138_01141 [Ralstonia sp. LMG 18095]